MKIVTFLYSIVLLLFLYATQLGKLLYVTLYVL
jgi:hypothetical protein